MAPNPKFVKLLEGLKDATSNGRLEWSETVDENIFRVTLDPTAAVRVGRGEDDSNGGVVYFATLTDQRGDSLETVSSDSSNDGAIHQLLHDLFDQARRHVKRIDALLDRLINTVNARTQKS